MLKRFMKLLTPDAESDTADDQRIALAAAVLLLEIAHADGDFSPAEQRLLGPVLKQHFAVTDDELDELLTAAREKRQNSHDLHQFTREINRNFSQPEKEEIAVALWQLVYADGRLDHFEEALMRQLGTLIGLSHRQLIDAKLQVSRA